MKRISLLVLFFSSGADFGLEHGRIDLLVMASAFVLLLWAAFRPLRRARNPNAVSGHAATRAG